MLGMSTKGCQFQMATVTQNTLQARCALDDAQANSMPHLHSRSRHRFKNDLPTRLSLRPSTVNRGAPKPPANFPPPTTILLSIDISLASNLSLVLSALP